MSSVIQTLQKKVGRAANSIAAPPLEDFAWEPLSEPRVALCLSTESPARLIVDPIREPTIGWLSDDDYIMRVPHAEEVNLTPIMPPSQSTWPLLSVVLTRNLHLGLPAKTDEIKADNFFQPTISSESHHALEVSHPNIAWDCFAVIVNESLVSDDLHKPLARRARTDGKRYRDKVCRDDGDCGAEKLETPSAAFKGSEHGNRKAFKQERGKVRRGMSIWDLLFPLLNRPVTLDFGEVIELPANLYSFQTKGVEFLIGTHSALLGDDMGTGKTVQTAVALRMLFQTGKIRDA